MDGYPHVSCCGVDNGCDQQYDESHLSPYGIQFFLGRAWLRGDINVGFACLPPVEFQATVDWHLSGCNDQFRSRFCSNLPAVVQKPAQPGGPCPAAACVPGPETLCLNGGRFSVRASWATGQGATGVGHAVPLTADTGYFWFFNSANVEVVVKVLNGCGVNHRYWVFAAGLTNVAVELRVVDAQTGTPKTYTNLQGRKFAPVQDTGAFATCP